MSEITITGGLPRDPELKETSNGRKFVRFTVADKRSYKDQSGQWQSADESYTDVTLWGDDAETVAGQLFRGSQVAVHGRLVTEKWEQGGQQRSKLAFKARSVYVQVRAARDQGQGQRPAPAGGPGADGWHNPSPAGSQAVQGAPSDPFAADMPASTPYSDGTTPF